MTFGDLKQRAAYLGSVAGKGDAVPGPDWASLVNQGLADYSWDTEYNEEETTFTTVINQAEYTIATPYFKTVKEAAYGTSTRLLKSTEADEAKYDPLWFMRAAGTPSRYLVARPNVIRLVDKPNTGGDTVTLRGTRIAAALSANSDLPACPDRFHEAIALRAAVLHCKQFVSSDADIARVASYENEYKTLVAGCRSYLGLERYGSLQRTVTTPGRGRVWSGGPNPYR